jgi:hypothetical protein
MGFLIVELDFDNWEDGYFVGDRREVEQFLILPKLTGATGTRKNGNHNI